MDTQNAFMFYFCGSSRKLFFNPCSPEGLPKHIFRRGFVATPWIISTEGHKTLNLHQYIGMDIFFLLIPK